MLNLSDTGLEAEGCAALSQGLLLLGRPPAVGPLCCLRALMLNANGLGDAGLASFAAALREGALPLLQDMGLGSNGIGDPGIGHLVDALRGEADGAECGRRQSRLRHLNLAFNAIVGAETVRALVAAMDGKAAVTAAAMGEKAEEEEENYMGRCPRRLLDLSENELMRKERQELELEVGRLYPHLKCVL